MTSPNSSPKSPPLIGSQNLNKANLAKPMPQHSNGYSKFKRRNVVWVGKQEEHCNQIVDTLLKAAAHCSTPTIEAKDESANKIVTKTEYKFVYFPPTSKFFWISVNEARRHEVYSRSAVRELYELKNGQYIKLHHFTCYKRGATTICKNCANRSTSHLKCLATKEIWVWYPGSANNSFND